MAARSVSFHIRPFGVSIIAALMLIPCAPAVAKTGVEEGTIEKFELSPEIEDIRTLDPEPDFPTWAPVRRRAHPEFEPKGLMVGAINVVPFAATQLSYDSNIYAAERFEIDDLVTQLSTGMQIEQLSGSKHSFKADLRADTFLYAQNERENRQEYAVATNYGYEILHDWTIGAGFRNALIHKERPEILSREFTHSPLSVHETEMKANIAHTFNRLKTSLGVKHTQRRFDNDVSLNNPTQLVVQDDGDFQSRSIQLGLEYTFPFDHFVFADIAFGTTDYDRAAFVPATQTYSGLRRDSANRSAFAGFRSNYKGLVIAEGALGIEDRNFDDPAIKDVRNLAARLDLFWNVTRLTTLSGQYRRGYIEDNEVIDGLVVNRSTVSLDHELRRYWWASLGYTLVNRDFANGTREDNSHSYFFETRYQFSPKLWLSAEARHTDLESTDAAREFSKDVLMLRLLTQY